MILKISAVLLSFVSCKTENGYWTEQFKVFEETGITKEMVNKYGPTKGCRGCSWITGRSNHKQSHADDCRKRFIEMMVNFLLCTQIAVVIAICFIIAKIY